MSLQIFYRANALQSNKFTCAVIFPEKVLYHFFVWSRNEEKLRTRDQLTTLLGKIYYSYKMRYIRDSL